MKGLFVLEIKGAHMIYNDLGSFSFDEADVVWQLQPEIKVLKDRWGTSSKPAAEPVRIEKTWSLKKEISDFCHDHCVEVQRMYVDCPPNSPEHFDYSERKVFEHIPPGTMIKVVTTRCLTYYGSTVINDAKETVAFQSGGITYTFTSDEIVSVTILEEKC